MTIDEHTLLDALVRLASGNNATASKGRVVFVESGAHVEWARSLCEHPDDLVFSSRTRGTSLVQSREYVATPFFEIDGPTIIRITDAQDYEAFLDDADLARAEGIFVEQLLNPAVILADQCGLGTTHPCILLQRLHVSESGEVRTAPGGDVLGTVGSTMDELCASVELLCINGDVCLNGVISPWTLDNARAQRPWLSRYLRTLDMLVGLRVAGRRGYRVSGFGGRLTEDLPEHLVEANDAPLLLWNDHEHLLCDTWTGQLFLLGPDAARLAELLLVTGSVERAGELAAATLRADRSVARAVIEGRLAGLTTPEPPPE